MTMCHAGRSSCLPLTAMMVAITVTGFGGSAMAAGKFAKENYEKIAKDMTVAQVETLIGPAAKSEPVQKVISNKREEITIEIKTWIDGEREYVGRFRNGKLETKPYPFDTKITAANYRKLKRGLTLKECEDLLGPSQIAPYEPKDLTIDGKTFRRTYRQWELVGFGTVQAVMDNEKLSIKETTIPFIYKKLTAADDNY